MSGILEQDPEVAADSALWQPLRHDRAVALFDAVPELAGDIEARPLDDAEAVLDMLGRLRDGPTPEEAITLAAYALGPRHAVWWGHECLQALPDLQTPEDRQMLTLCALWAAHPDDDNRYAALEAGDAAARPGPGAWLAMAAGWSTGSIAPPDAAHVPGRPFMTARAVNGAVLTFLARVPQPARRGQIGAFVGMAEFLARGGTD